MKFTPILIILCLLASCNNAEKKKSVATQNAIDSARGAADQQKSLHDTGTENVQLEKVTDNDTAAIGTIEHNLDSIRAKLFYKKEAIAAAREHRPVDSAKVEAKLKKVEEKILQENTQHR